MKALTVKNPWAYCIFHFGKDVENRIWYTSHRGRIFIHVSKKQDYSYPATDIIYNTQLDIGNMGETDGCIIGTVEIVDCVKNHKSKWADKGMWHWVLANPLLLPRPMPTKGRLGLWEYNP
jgi:hypothetical protein